MISLIYTQVSKQKDILKYEETQRRQHTQALFGKTTFWNVTNQKSQNTQFGNKDII